MASSDSIDLSVSIGDATFTASGPSALVMEAFGEFKALLAQGDLSPASKSSAKQGGAHGSGDSKSAHKVPLGKFLKRNWPNQHAQATAIVTWAKRYEGKDKLKPGEMETYWRKGGSGAKPRNPTQVLQTGEKQGWLYGEGGGYYSVTAHGEAMVDNTPEA